MIVTTGATVSFVTFVIVAEVTPTPELATVNERLVPSVTPVVFAVMLHVVAPALITTVLLVTVPLADVRVIVRCLVAAGVIEPVKSTLAAPSRLMIVGGLVNARARVRVSFETVVVASVTFELELAARNGMFWPSGTLLALSVMVQFVAPAAIPTLLLVRVPAVVVMVMVCGLVERRRDSAREGDRRDVRRIDDGWRVGERQGSRRCVLRDCSRSTGHPDHRCWRR